MKSRNIIIVGNLPPPITGQHVQTQLNADLLSELFNVTIVDTSTGSEDIITNLNVLDRVRHYLAVGSRIRQAVEQHTPDAAVWHSISGQGIGHMRDIATVLPSVGRSTPVIAVVHSGRFDELLSSVPLRPTTKLLARRIKRFVFLSEILSERCAPYLPIEKRHVIPNTIESALTPDATAVLNKLGRRSTLVSREYVHRILFVANMIPSKGYMALVRSLPSLPQNGVSFEARFIGRWKSDSDRSEFERAIDDLNLRQQVVHLGQLRDREHLAREYLAADVFVLPTYYPTEAQPMSVIEALASATPVVVSRHASLPSMVVEGREARFVDPHSPESIASAIHDLLRPEVWGTAARYARTRFEERYSAEIVLKKWADLLGRADE